MNPARDFGPKVFAWLAGWGNVAFTGGRDIPYFLVPLFGPIVGAIVGAFAYRKLIGRHLPCDICVVEEKETTTPSEQKLRCNMTTGQLNMTEKIYRCARPGHHQLPRGRNGSRCQYH